MSRSQPTISNPATRFYRWAGGDGYLAWFNRENKQEVKEPLPFRFVVLDELSTIVGWSESNDSGIWSNEIRDTKKEELVVRVRAGVLERGTYDEIKDSIKSKGGKYARSVFIAYKQDGKWVIGNFKVAGAAVSSWFELRKTLGVPLDSKGIGIALTGSEHIEKNKKVYYYIPTFEMFKTSEDDEATFGELDNQLQDYLAKYLARRVTDREERAELADPMGLGPLPESRSDALEDLDKPIDLSEIPF